MKKVLSVLLACLMTFSLLGCSKESVKLKKDSESYVGLDYKNVVNELKNMGFKNIQCFSYNDLTYSELDKENTIIEVIIDGKDFHKDEVVSSSASVEITFHTITRYKIPFSSSNTNNYEVSELENLLIQTGFTNIENRKVFDLDKDKGETYSLECEINGNKEFYDIDEIPYDSNICIIEHYPYEKYDISIDIDFVGNLIFNKYNVNVLIDGEKVDSLKHGKDAQLNYHVKQGERIFRFEKEDSSDVFGELIFDVSNNVYASYQLICRGEQIELTEQYKKYFDTLTEDDIKVSFDEKSLLNRDYNDVIKDLQDVGFNNLYTEEIYGPWSFTKHNNYTTKVTINGSDTINKGDIFKKNAEIIISYYVVQDISDTTNKYEAESSTEQQDENAKYAFVADYDDYERYYIFDTGTGRVKIFTTIDTSVISGKFVGEIGSKYTITYKDDGEEWEETFNFSSKSRAKLTDCYYDEYDCKKVSTSEAEKTLKNLDSIVDGYYEKLAEQELKKQEAKNQETQSESNKETSGAEQTVDPKSTLRIDQAKRAFEYVFNELYPYGVEYHWWYADKTQYDDGSWMIACPVTITNGFNAKYDAIAEAYVNNTTQKVENYHVIE